MVLERSGDTPAEASPQAFEAALAAVSAPPSADAQPAAAQPATAEPIAAAAQVALAPVALPAGWQITTAEVSHSLARTFQKAAGDDGDALAAVYARLFVWDLDLRRDLQRGDKVEVAWRKDSTGDIEVVAARLHSGKLGRTLAAYRWQAPGDAFTSYWQEDGTEVPYRLKDGPLRDYEQITSLLKDRPSHAGMDFKAPVGTPVQSPKAGTVTRVNWNWSANGNCVEVKHDDGAMIKYLHLSENRVAKGDRVGASDVIALTGNTGRSTAPHLHYQVEKSGKVVDPLEYHGTERRRVDGATLQSLMQETSRLDAILGQAIASR
jgi:murein DD-endopeptidase MepM/ murein hydrolase activator NlpD